MLSAASSHHGRPAAQLAGEIPPQGRDRIIKYKHNRGGALPCGSPTEQGSTGDKNKKKKLQREYFPARRAGQRLSSRMSVNQGDMLTFISE